MPPGGQYIADQPFQVNSEAAPMPQFTSDMARTNQQRRKINFYKREEAPSSGLRSRGPIQPQESQGISLSDYVDRRVPILGADSELHLGVPGQDHIKICLSVSDFIPSRFLSLETLLMGRFAFLVARLQSCLFPPPNDSSRWQDHDRGVVQRGGACCARLYHLD